MSKKHQPDHAAELERAFARWDDIHENGCNDPFHDDSVNLNLVRNHILHHRSQLEETPTLFGFPEIYNREVPPEMPHGFMARPNDIRAAAGISLSAYQADPNYQFIISHRDEIPPKAHDKMLVGYALNSVSGLQNAVIGGDLLVMRRHEQPENTLKTLERCANQIRDYLQKENIETVDDPVFDGADDENFGEEFDEDYSEEPEEEFGEPTMTMQ